MQLSLKKGRNVVQILQFCKSHNFKNYDPNIKPGDKILMKKRCYFDICSPYIKIHLLTDIKHCHFSLIEKGATHPRTHTSLSFH